MENEYRKCLEKAQSSTCIDILGEEVAWEVYEGCQ